MVLSRYLRFRDDHVSDSLLVLALLLLLAELEAQHQLCGSTTHCPQHSQILKMAATVSICLFLCSYGAIEWRLKSTERDNGSPLLGYLTSRRGRNH